MNMKNDLMKTAGNINNSNQVTYSKPYDERLILIRGKAFQYGFIAMLAYYGLLILLNGWASRFVEISVLIFMGMVFGGMIWAAYSIFHDAYFKLGENEQNARIAFTAAGFMIIVMGIIRIKNGMAFQNGRVSMDDIGMMILGGFDLYICILVSIRKMLDKEGKYDEKSEIESGSSAS